MSISLNKIRIDFGLFVNDDEYDLKTLEPDLLDNIGVDIVPVLFSNNLTIILSTILRFGETSSPI